MITITISTDDKARSEEAAGDRMRTLADLFAQLAPVLFSKVPCGAPPVPPVDSPAQPPVWPLALLPLGFALKRIVDVDGSVRRISATATSHVEAAMERFVIDDDEHEWAVASVRIGVAEQMLSTGPIPTQVFTAGCYHMEVMPGELVTIDLVPIDDDTTVARAEPTGCTAVCSLSRPR